MEKKEVEQLKTRLKNQQNEYSSVERSLLSVTAEAERWKKHGKEMDDKMAELTRESVQWPLEPAPLVSLTPSHPLPHSHSHTHTHTHTPPPRCSL